MTLTACSFKATTPIQLADRLRQVCGLRSWQSVGFAIERSEELVIVAPINAMRAERVGRVKGAHAASPASGPLTRPSAPAKMFGRSDGTLFGVVVPMRVEFSRSSSLESAPGVSCCYADSKSSGGSEPSRNHERDSRVCGHACALPDAD